MNGASRGVMCLLAGSSLISAVSAQDATSAAPATEAAQPQGTGEISGRVFNAETGRALSRAVVTIDGTARQALTNDFGEYSFYNVPAGPVRLRVSYTGRDPLYRSVDVPAGGEAQLDFTFSGAESVAATDDDGETVFELEAFEVKATDYQTATEYAIQQERFAPTLRNVVDTEAFGIVPDGNVGEFVKFMPGVQVDYGTASYSSGADASSISVRGFSSSQIPVTIDGVPVSSAVAGSLDRTVALDTLSINNAARVEVIKVPTPDSPNASIGGSVNLVSKSAFEYPKRTVRFRVWTTINSQDFDDFWKKTPGPVEGSSYKARPGVEMTLAYPITDTFGFTLTLARSDSYDRGSSNKTDYAFDGIEVGPFVDTDGTVIGELKNLADDDDDGDGIIDSRDDDWDNDEILNEADADADGDGVPDTAYTKYGEGGEGVYADAAHPFLNNVSVSDSPRLSTRTSGAMKFDWRPIEGHLLTFNIQHSIFESREAERTFEMNAGARDGVLSYGPDHIFSDIGNGKSGIKTLALDKDSDSTSGYLRWVYNDKGWDITAHFSHAVSNASINSIENGHFGAAELSMGGITLSRYSDIQDGLPGKIEYYGLVPGKELPYSEDSSDRAALANADVVQGLVDDGILVSLDPSKLASYTLNGFDPENPEASDLIVEGGAKPYEEYHHDLQGGYSSRT